MLELIFHTDNGHGWIEVSKSLVKKFGTRVSQFSYEKDDKVFLEEDCDAGRFLKALKDDGIEVKIVGKNFNGSHPIRNYNRYRG